MTHDIQNPIFLAQENNANNPAMLRGDKASSKPCPSSSTSRARYIPPAAQQIRQQASRPCLKQKAEIEFGRNEP